MFVAGFLKDSGFAASASRVFGFGAVFLNVFRFVTGTFKDFMPTTSSPKFPGLAADTTKVFVFVAGNRKAHPQLQHRPALASPASCPRAMLCM